MPTYKLIDSAVTNNQPEDNSVDKKTGPSSNERLRIEMSKLKFRSRIDRVKYLSNFNLFTYLVAWAYRSLTHVEEEKRLEMALKVLEDMTLEDRLEHAFALCRMTPQEIKNRKKKGEGLQFKAMGLMGRSAWANLSLEEKQRYKDAIQAAKNSIRDEYVSVSWY